MYILGINAYHGDSSACLLKDGHLVAAAEEERFRRIKHWAGLPTRAIQYCLGEAGISAQELDWIAVNRDPRAHLQRKLLFVLARRPSLALLRQRLSNMGDISTLRRLLARELHVKERALRARVVNVEHHLAHAASAFFTSPFEQAAVASVDGFGDFVSTMAALGSGSRLRVLWKVYYPHSLGLFYTAITQFLGFKKYGDEYKVMGLAAYGRPRFLQELRQVLLARDGRGFSLNLRYFVHHVQGVSMSWSGAEPTMSDVYSLHLEALLGPARRPGEPLLERHQDIAASAQALYEEFFFRMLWKLYRQSPTANLCLAGGCALNSVANGKVFERTPFRELYIQPAAGDAGGALGAAFYVWHQVLGRPRSFTMRTAYWGPSFHRSQYEQDIRARGRQLERLGCTVREVQDEELLLKQTARHIAHGKVVGWFQGRMEWGPRALGNRSILADPRRAEMKDVLNARVKRRENFRPFAPSVLLEQTHKYFELSYPDPFMLKVYPIRPHRRAEIPAVAHVDGSGRLQTVSREENPLYWRLIKEFEAITGVALVLNTSFNENEPIVCQPSEALECFLRTRMDVLVLGPFVLQRGG
jgi:carbamoyltransferase